MKTIKIYNETNRFIIDWTLNTLCTYHCSYCPPRLHKGINVVKSKQEDPIIIKEFLTKIQKEVAGRSVHIFVNGGEPTISPSLETIIDFCNDAGWCLYVNTNGSRSIDWWKEYAHKVYKVTISYHPESVDEEIFEKVKYIGTQTNVGVFTLMYPVSPFWEKSVDAFERFKDVPNITLEPSRVFQREKNREGTSTSYEYSEEQLNWLTANTGLNIRGASKPPPLNNHYGNTFFQDEFGHISKFDEVESVNNRTNKFKGWDCNMGKDHIYVSESGYIFMAACRTAQLKPFSSIFNFTGLLKNSVKCNEEWCMCTADVLIPKEFNYE